MYTGVWIKIILCCPKGGSKIYSSLKKALNYYAICM